MTQYRPNPQDAPILKEITETIRLSLTKWYGPGARLQSPDPKIRSYQYCFMLRYLVSIPSAQGKAILVKIRRNPKMDAIHQTFRADIHRNMTVEYETLEYLYENLALSNAGFSAIRPLTFLEKYSAIVMEEIPSRTMTRLMVDQRAGQKDWDSSELKDAARKTGRWLYTFHHHLHQAEERPYTTDDIQEEARGFAERIESYSQGRVRARPILEQFAAGLENIQIDRMKFSQTHSDMTTNNVLYTDGNEVCIIDVKNRPAPIYEDLGLILTYPETSKPQIFSAGLYYSETLLCNYRAEILAGYFEQEPGQELLARIYAALKILDKWRMYEELMGRYKGVKRVLSILGAPLVSAYFQKLFRKYLKRIESPETGWNCQKDKTTAASSA